MTLHLVYRDDHCVVVNKPSGMIVHRGWADDEHDALRTVRDLIGAQVYPVHRLDRGTSGALLFALHVEAARFYGAAFAASAHGGEAAISKVYWALTRGHPPEQGCIDHPVPKAPGEARVPAVTEYKRLGTSGRYALVECRPKTGRLHQIRRHMKHLSCPLIGDVRYGKGEHNRLFRDKYALDRLALHALSLTVPAFGESRSLQVHIPVSGSLRDCLAALGLLPEVE